MRHTFILVCHAEALYVLERTRQTLMKLLLALWLALGNSFQSTAACF